MGPQDLLMLDALIKHRGLVRRRVVSAADRERAKAKRKAERRARRAQRRR